MNTQSDASSRSSWCDYCQAYTNVVVRRGRCNQCQRLRIHSLLRERGSGSWPLIDNTYTTRRTRSPRIPLFVLGQRDRVVDNAQRQHAYDDSDVRLIRIARDETPNVETRSIEGVSSVRSNPAIQLSSALLQAVFGQHPVQQQEAVLGDSSPQEQGYVRIENQVVRDDTNDFLEYESDDALSYGTAEIILYNLPQMDMSYTNVSMTRTYDEHSCSICFGLFPWANNTSTNNDKTNENAQHDNDETVCVLPCLHWFHRTCCVKWLRRKNSCPQCRAQLPSTNSEYNQAHQLNVSAFQEWCKAYKEKRNK